MPRQINEKARIQAFTPEKAIRMDWAVHAEKVGCINAYRHHLQEQHKAKLLWLERLEAKSKALSDREELDASTSKR